MRKGAHKLLYTCNTTALNTPMACTNCGLKSEQARVGHIEAGAHNVLKRN